MYICLSCTYIPTHLSSTILRKHWLVSQYNIISRRQVEAKLTHVAGECRPERICRWKDEESDGDIKKDGSQDDDVIQVWADETNNPGEMKQQQ